MSDPREVEELEALVEQFLDRREQEPELTPEQFAAEHPEVGPALLGALHSTLEVMATLGDEAEELPESIGTFAVVREIGRGGMGVVYEVERDGERRALKRLGVAALMQRHAQQRFQREARSLMRLRHPGVVTVHEVGAADGLPFLVMDLVEGQSLAGMGPLVWRRAVELCRDLGRGLAAVHEAGMCHRDLKPQNVLVGGDGQPVLVDFGLVHDAADVTLTGTGDLLGTPRYLAPEQAAGQPTDTRTDVYALGLILAELVTGHPVREGTDRSTVLAAAASSKPPDLSGVANVPADLVRVVRMATERRPEWRYPTALAMVDDLDRLLSGDSVRARPPGLFVRGTEVLRRRPRSVMGWSATVLVVGLVGGLWLRAELLAGRAGQAQAHFEDAVLAWCEQDEVAAQLAIDATLAAAPEHEGALALLHIRGIGVASWGPSSPRIDALRDGLAARSEARWPDAVVAFGAAATAKLTCPLSRILLSSAQEQVGNLAEAERELTTAAELMPTSAALAHSLGSVQSRRRDVRAAAGSYRRAVELRPGSFSLRYRLARAYYGFDPEAALREIVAALALLEPDRDRELRSGKQLQASALDLLGRTEEALVILRRLAEANPKDVKACFNLAYALDRQLLVREAKEWYEKALTIEPANQSAALCLVWLLATADQTELRDPDRAERMLVEVLERDRGQSKKVLLMVRDFGFRTGRIDRLVAIMTELMERPGISQHARAALEHTRNNVRSGAPKTGR